MKTQIQNKIQAEPVTSLALANIVFTALQLLAIPVAPWLHLVILIVSYIATVWATRKRVSPTP